MPMSVDAMGGPHMNECKCSACRGGTPEPRADRQARRPPADDLDPVFCHRCDAYTLEPRHQCPTTGDWLCDYCYGGM
jgi:hypothetical protein